MAQAAGVTPGGNQGHGGSENHNGNNMNDNGDDDRESWNQVVIWNPLE